jgi:hypothetical protein
LRENLEAIAHESQAIEEDYLDPALLRFTGGACVAARRFAGALVAGFDPVLTQELGAWVRGRSVA